jgi:hypothetical protein
VTYIIITEELVELGAAKRLAYAHELRFQGFFLEQQYSWWILHSLSHVVWFVLKLV